MVSLEIRSDYEPSALALAWIAHINVHLLTVWERSAITRQTLRDMIVRTWLFGVWPILDIRKSANVYAYRFERGSVERRWRDSCTRGSRRAVLKGMRIS